MNKLKTAKKHGRVSDAAVRAKTGKTWSEWPVSTCHHTKTKEPGLREENRVPDLHAFGEDQSGTSTDKPSLRPMIPPRPRRP